MSGKMYISLRLGHRTRIWGCQNLHILGALKRLPINNLLLSEQPKKKCFLR